MTKKMRVEKHNALNAEIEAMNNMDFEQLSKYEIEATHLNFLIAQEMLFSDPLMPNDERKEALTHNEKYFIYKLLSAGAKMTAPKKSRGRPSKNKPIISNYFCSWGFNTQKIKAQRVEKLAAKLGSYNKAYQVVAELESKALSTIRKQHESYKVEHPEIILEENKDKQSHRE